MDWLINTLYYVVPFIVLLGILVFVHEFGHYLMAKFSGVQVEAFSIGFGKQFFKISLGIFGIILTGEGWGILRNDNQQRMPVRTDHTPILLGVNTKLQGHIDIAAQPIYFRLRGGKTQQQEGTAKIKR